MLLTSGAFLRSLRWTLSGLQGQALCSSLSLPVSCPLRLQLHPEALHSQGRGVLLSHCCEIKLEGSSGTPKALQLILPPGKSAEKYNCVVSQIKSRAALAAAELIQ